MRESVDVILNDDRTLRVTLERDDDTGRPMNLLLGAGSGRGDAYRQDPGASIYVPASAQLGFVDALRALNRRTR